MLHGAVSVTCFHSISLGLLGRFSLLDVDGDNALEYYEFSEYSGDTPTAQHIFHAMDSDGDDLVTYSEIVDTIRVLEQQSTEGTEDVPVGNHPEDRVTTPYTDQDVIPPGTQTQPAEPTPLSVSENGPPGAGDGGPQTTDTDHDTTGTVGPASGADGATTTTTSPDMATTGASSSPESDGTVSEADESMSDSGSEGKTDEGEAGKTVAGEDEEKSDEEMKKKEGALETLTGIVITVILEHLHGVLNNWSSFTGTYCQLSNLLLNLWFQLFSKGFMDLI